MRSGRRAAECIRPLVEGAAAGEGTAIRVFSERYSRQDADGGGGCLSWHIIHTIAIGKTLPATERG
jgi:hypothetical protein